jgi:hypothetical protein
MRERACVGLGLAMFVLALGAPASGAPGDSAAPVAHYEAPAPVRIYRFHVYSTMKARWKKKATLETLVVTSDGGMRTGDRGLLERRAEAASGAAGDPRPTDWVPFANVTLKRLLPKGRVELEIESEAEEAKVKRGGKLPFAPGQSVRLQIDRVLDG